MDGKSPDQRLQKRARKIPAGFQFRPNDWELVLYLRRRVHGAYVEEDLFHDVNIYSYHPSKLIELFALRNEKKAYLFSQRKRKYPNGSRPCRSADGGFWKASGKDAPVKNAAGEVVGTKRALSFYEGHQVTKGSKTKWLMHEYKIHDRPPDHPSINNINGCSTFDDWVLCVVYLNEKTPLKDIADHDEEEEDIKFHSTASCPRQEEAAHTTTVAAAAASSQTLNMAMVLHDMDAAATMLLGNTPWHDDETANAMWQHYPSMSSPPDDHQVHMMDDAAAILEYRRRRGKDIVVDVESYTYFCGGRYDDTVDTYPSFMPLDPLSALEYPLPTMVDDELEPLSTSFSWPPAGSPAEHKVLQYGHDLQQQDYYNNGMPFDTMPYDQYYPEVTPLSVIRPPAPAAMDQLHAPYTSSWNSVASSCAPSSSPEPAPGQGMGRAATDADHLNGGGTSCSGMPSYYDLHRLEDHIAMPSFADDEAWNVQNQLSDGGAEELSVDDFLVSDMIVMAS